ncbi:hypothetical protein F909_01763 [Acinetobacter sp. ANC 3929]|nr:hypothetical protein F909_01763 [Acinetobacter sp. ANC 3929]
MGRNEFFDQPIILLLFAYSKYLSNKNKKLKIILLPVSQSKRLTRQISTYIDFNQEYYNDDAQYSS